MTAPVADERLKPLPMVAAWFAARHAEDQETVANNLIVALFPLWQLMRFDELNASTAVWLSSVLPRVETAFLQSQRLSAVFNANVRAAELPTDVPLLIDVPEVEFPPIIPDSSFRMPPLLETSMPQPVAELLADQPVADPVAPADAPGRAADVARLIERGRQIGTPQWVLDRIEQMADSRAGVGQQRVELQEFPRQEVATSLTIEANYNTKRAMPGQEQQLMQDALSRSSGAAVRQAMNGGRGVTDRVVELDRKIKGFARVTDSDPCPFCALLASRGAVFGKGSFIASDAKMEADRRREGTTWALNPEAARDVPEGWTNVAKVHNNCKCHLRPVYANESVWDAGAKHFLDLWNNRKVTTQDTLDILERNPRLSGYRLQRAVDLKAFRRALKEKPFKGSQFDMAAMRRDLQARRSGLADNGFATDSPQVQAAERSIAMMR